MSEEAPGPRALARLGPVTRLLHLSDTHLHAPGAERLHPEIDPRRRLEQVLDRARAYGPFDAVVVTGDVCDDGSREGAEAVKDLIADLAPVVLAVPGNHDLAGPIGQVFGPPVAEVGPWHIVGASTEVEGEVAGVGDGVLEALREIGGRPAVLLMHHPIESRSTHEWFTLRGREAVVAAVEAHKHPLVILSGHTHEAYEGRLGNAQLLGAPATYYSIRHRGDEFDFVKDEFGAAVVNLDDEALTASVELVIHHDEACGEDHISLPDQGV